MIQRSMVKERITLTLLAADIPFHACLSNWHQIGSTLKFVPLVDFQWPGFLGIPIQHRVVFVDQYPRELKPDDMYEIEEQWLDFKKIFVANGRPARIKGELAAQWFTVEEFIQAVENIPKSGNPFSLNLTNAEQQVMINRLQLEVEKLRLRVTDGE